MADSGLLVGVLTAVTALAASYLTARGTSRAALGQARAAATAQALREERERRRATYRELIGRVHEFLEALWRVVEVDDLPDREARDALLRQIHAQAGAAMSRVTLATRDVLLDGPAELSAAAERLRELALDFQHGVLTLVGDASGERRAAHNAAYRRVRAEYLTFITLALDALSVEPPPAT